MQIDRLIFVCLCLLTWNMPASWAQFTIDIDLDAAPFQYVETQDDNRVSRLIADLKAGKNRLEYSEQRGYLTALIKALDIPASSQTLVFSKTSMQVRHISPRNPRAIYFNDDTYLGWIHGSSLVEISTVDPKLGAAFYTVDMMPWRAKIQRVNYDCLACHATSMTQGIPGHTVRSVMPGYDGQVEIQQQSYVTTDSSPFSERWGGWYVTGYHGEMRHMGNSYLRGGQLDTLHNGNRGSLRDEFETENYLLPTSDIVALLVLEHQTQMQNSFTKADFFVRQLLHEEPSQTLVDSEERRWQLSSIAREVVERLLFCQETQLTSPIRGSNAFAEEFVARGPMDARGRSLREFDLQTRLFKLPCSYLIYTPSFDALTPCLREEILRQLLAVLSDQDQSPSYSHLSTETRREILHILLQTKNDLPAEWVHFKQPSG